MLPFAILMFAFALLLFVYGLAIRKTRDCSLIPHSEKAAIRDKEDYARRFGKVVMWVALAPAIAGAAAVMSELGVPVRPIGYVLACNTALFIYVGVRVFMNEKSGEDK